MSSALLLQVFVFVVLILVHHFLLAPLLDKNKVWLYILLTALLMGLFATYCFALHPRPEDAPPPPWAQERPMEPRYEAPREGRGGPLRPQWMEMLIGILLVGGDLGLIAYQRMRQNEKRLQELRTESLQQQLVSLRYQINPHFFMNTLNNIQSLIYTDPEKAAEAVGGFSKLMRIVLYEGNDPTIPLSREIEYLRHYLSLMRLRYPEAVRIDTALPRETGDAAVPPLVMASFVENAFKHGISYERGSFIRIVLELTRNRISFRCTNSRAESRQTEQHGLGMNNVRKRLTLLYGNDFALHIEESDAQYDVLLDIPVKPVRNA